MAGDLGMYNLNLNIICTLSLPSVSLSFMFQTACIPWMQKIILLFLYQSKYSPDIHINASPLIIVTEGLVITVLT